MQSAATFINVVWHVGATMCNIHMVIVLIRQIFVMLSELKGEANIMKIDIHALDTDTNKLCQRKA